MKKNTPQSTRLGSLTFAFLNFFFLTAYAQCPDTSLGDQTTYGQDQWIGYVYTFTEVENPPVNPFETYRGFLTRSENFDLDLAEGSISGNDICGSYDAKFAIRFKMHKTLTPGYYTFLVGGDDGYRLSVDGGTTFLPNASAWYNHSYISSQTTIYLSGETDFVYEFYEDATTARVSFNYTFAPCNSTAPTTISGNVIYSCVGITTLSADGGIAGENSSYEWGTGTTVGQNIIPGATQQTYTTTTTGSYWVRRLQAGPCSGYTDGVATTVTASNNTPGNPTIFGNNEWTVYAYTDVAVNFNNPNYAYKGYYTQNTLGFSSWTGDHSWPKGGSPDQSDNYVGCAIGQVNDFAFRYKRQGFPCGEYTLFMDNWDDDTTVYINGIQVWTWVGWSGGANDTDKTLGNYNLDENTTIEVYTREGGGDANSQLNITEVSPSTAPTSINGSAVACAGSVITLSANGGVLGTASEYQWGTGDVGTNIIAGQTGSTISTVIPGNTTYWVRIKKTACDNFTTAATLAVTTPAPVVYNGAWTGTPDSATAVEIQVDLTLADDMEVCSCHVTQNAVLTVNSEVDLTVTGQVRVDTGSNLILQNKASLLQTSNIQNSGNIDVIRTGSKVMRLDYSIWSSPVTGQELLDFSPLTLTNRFYTFNTVANDFSPVTPSGNYFETAKGYLIRVPYNHPLTPTTYTGTFTGEPHNGDISLPLAYNGSSSFTMIGNPYPSPVDIVTFIDTNLGVIEGTLWFWRKTNNTNVTSYSTITKFAYNPNTAPGGENEYATDPQGVMNTAQGFFVNATSAASVEFNNSMRLGNSTNQFFKQAPADTNVSRLWLYATNTDGEFSSAVIGYTPEATLGYDNGIDGRGFSGGNFSIYSIANEETLVIQGRPAFTINDVVPVGINISNAGTYNITMGKADGIFITGQEVFLKDTFMDITTSLTNAENGYTFSSEPGTFNSRFEIIYTTATMGLTNPDTLSTSIYSAHKQLIATANSPIESVTAYDMLGRTVYHKEGIAANTFESDIINVSQGLVIVKVILQNKQQISQKLLFK